MAHSGAAYARSLTVPDDSRPMGPGRVDFVNLDRGAVALATLQPGWRWSEHVKARAGSDRCEVGHFGYAVSGRMRVAMADGSEYEIGPGDVFSVPPGHDAWVVGDEPCVHVDFGAVLAGGPHAFQSAVTETAR